MKASFTAALIAGLALGVGCAGQKSAKVDESWVARVPEDQMGAVRDARSAQLRAEDDARRAEVQRQDAERAIEGAELEEDAVRKQIEADTARLEAARQTGNAGAINTANQKLKASNAGLSAAQARVAWLEQEAEAKAAQAELKRRQVEVARAQVNLAEYEALKNSGDVRAQELSEADFRAALSDAQSEVAEAERRVSDEQRQAQQARAEFNRWQQVGVGGAGDQR